MTSSWNLENKQIEKGAVAAESMPSRSGEVSALASAQAPFIVFDASSLCGHKGGLGMITLTAERPVATSEEGVVLDIVVVANLRATVPALRSLKEAIEAVLTLDEQARDRDVRAIIETFGEQQSIAGHPLPGPTKN